MSVAFVESNIPGIIVDLEPLSGNFETDYLQVCKKYDVRPFRILKFGLNMPPLPIKEADSGLISGGHSPQIVTTDGKQPVQSGRVRKFLGEKREALIQDFLKKANLDCENFKNHSTSWTRTTTPYLSRYKYTATIDIEAKETDDSLNSLYKLEIRGYKLSLTMSDVLNTIANSMTNLVEIALYNCKLNEQHVSFINSLMVLGSLRTASIDRNPLIPETYYASLLSEWSSIRILSLRENNIGNLGANSISTALKTNRVLVALDLFGNKIQKYGALGLADALKENNVLQSLNLGRNRLGDEGVSILLEPLKNIALSSDEVALRRRAMLVADRLRLEANKKKFGSSSSVKNGDAAKDKKPGGKTSAPPMGKKPLDSAAQPKTSSTTQFKEPKKSSSNSTAEDKKPKKTSTPKGKKTPKDDDEQVDPLVIADPMFELNNQFYIQGNRSLNNLNLCGNAITEYGLNTLLLAVLEQENSAEHGNEPFLGLFKISLQVYNDLK